MRRIDPHDESGFALVMAMFVLLVLTISGISIYQYTSGNSTSTRLTQQKTSASALAETGLQQAGSILNNPSNNALYPNVLCATPSMTCRRTDFATGYAVWGGTLDTRSGTWSLTSTGYVADADTATGSAQTRYTMTATVHVTATLTQPLNNPAWNFVYATHAATPGVCDETIQQSVTIASPLYVNGNLCLQNTASIVSGPLDVKGSLTLSQKQNSVGSAASPISDAHIGGGCKYQSNAFHVPCQGAVDNVYARVLDTTPSTVTPPTVYWDTWYQNASPGPYFPCVSPTGTVPVFDNDQGSTPDATKRNNSVTSIFNLTPATSYSCQTAAGELSWNAGTHVLTVSGTIFIDGSATIQNGAVNRYTGQATLYLSGTYFQKNSTLCAGLNASGTGCDTSSWDPNAAILAIVANGSGGQVNPWDGAQFVSGAFQGAVYATASIDTDTTASIDGPICASAINLGQSVSTSFPTITTVPVGMPSNPTVYAQPETMIYTSG